MTPAANHSSPGPGVAGGVAQHEEAVRKDEGVDGGHGITGGYVHFH